MTRLAGIELTPSRCALVDLDVSSRGPARIRAFRTVGWSPENPAALAALLRALRQSNVMPARALVTVWGVGRSSRHLSLPSADDEQLRAMALAQAGVTAQATDLGSTRAVLTDRVADWRSTGVREAAVVTADAAALRARLAPLVQAGFRIDAAITPAVALASLPTLLGTIDDGAAEAYVAVNAEAVAVAVVRHGALVFGQEIPLAFGAARPQSAAEARTMAGEATEYVRRLAPELKRTFVAVKQQSHDDVVRMFLCGELPDLRSLTAPLMQALRIDVATLDATQGLAGRPGDAVEPEIRERAGELRVAWATGADTGRTFDLQPRQARAMQEGAGWPSRAAVLAAGVVLLVAAVLAARALAPSRDTTGEVRALRHEVAGLESRLRAAERAHGQPVVPPPSIVPAVPAPPATRAAAKAAGGPHPGKAAGREAADHDQSEPVVQCILYGPDRRLALVDRRVVRVGDAVDGGVIAQIEPKAIVVRRPSGDLRRIEVRQPAGSLAGRSDAR